MIVDEQVNTALIAHDLGNLLQIAASALRHIDRNLDSKARVRVRRFERAADESLARAGLLSQALVNRAVGSSPLPFEIVSPDETIGKIMHLIDFASGPDIEVHYEISDQVPRVLCAVRDLENALLNLVTNARHAMPEGGQLHVSVVRHGHSAVLRVADTGAGMCADMAERAFSPFFTTKGARGGSGLGLAMVRDFAERAGGSAEIQSVVGSGTSVTVRLPEASSIGMAD